MGESSSNLQKRHFHRGYAAYADMADGGTTGPHVISGDHHSGGGHQFVGSNLHAGTVNFGSSMSSRGALPCTLSYTHLSGLTAAAAVPSTLRELPDLLDPYFVGREDVLEQISQALSLTYEDHPARCVVWGMSGLGKTQVALKYALTSYRRKDPSTSNGKKAYEYVFWVSAASAEKINEGFIRIADRLGLVQAAPNQSAKVAALRTWLESTTASKWLLVLDDANEASAEVTRDMVPHVNANGHLLFTTQTQAVAQSLGTAYGEQHKVIELQFLGQKDTSEVFRRGAQAAKSRTNKESFDGAEVAEIVRLTGSLPLAVAQAAAYMRETRRTASQVCDSLRTGGEVVLLWQGKLSRYEQHSVLAVLNLKVQQLEQTLPGGLDLLRLFLFLDPEQIPISILTSGSEVLIMEQKRKRTEDINETIESPQGKRRKVLPKMASELQLPGHIRVPSPGKTGFDRPRKFSAAETERNVPSQDGGRRTGTETCKTLAIALLQDTPRLDQALEALVSSALVKDVSNGPARAFWMHDLTHRLLRAKLLGTSERSQRLDATVEIVCAGFIGIESYEPELWPKFRKYSAHLQALEGRAAEIGSGAQAYFWQAMTKYGAWVSVSQSKVEAIKVMERALKGSMEAPGPTDLVTLTCMYSLASIYLNHGELEKACNMAGKVIEEGGKVSGPADLLVLASKSTLMDIWLDQGKITEAENLGIQLLSTAQQKFGEGHWLTSILTGRLSAVFQEQGRLEEAERMTSQQLATTIKYEGSDSQMVAYAESDLAVIYYSQYRFDEAEQLLLGAKTSWERSGAIKHPYYASTKSWLALVLWKTNQHNKAIQEQSEVVELSREVLGENHPYTIAGKAQLGDWLRRMNELPAAESVAAS